MTHASQARQAAVVDHGTLALPGFGITGDLLETVLQRLSTKELVRLGIVCKGWREVMARPEVYREFSVPQYGPITKSTNSQKLNRVTKLYVATCFYSFYLLHLRDKYSGSIYVHIVLAVSLTLCYKCTVTIDTCTLLILLHTRLSVS
jgi:hypothetical protein